MSGAGEEPTACDGARGEYGHMGEVVHVPAQVHGKLHLLAHQGHFNSFCPHCH